MQLRLNINRNQVALIGALLGVFWLFVTIATRQQQSEAGLSLTETTDPATVINGPAALTMNSAPIVYDDHWRVNSNGADPLEPADPWQEPAGRLHFTYQGADLALLLAVGDYWGYLYVTVDGAPANRLPHLPNNHNAAAQEAGYRTFYAPEATIDSAPVAQWVPIHHAADATDLHEVDVEIWRSWGQTPLRGVAVDTLPEQPLPLWPGIALILCSGWLSLPLWLNRLYALLANPRIDDIRTGIARRLLPARAANSAFPVALFGLLLIGSAIITGQWQVTLLGLLALAWAGLQRPVLWSSALLLGLPFYFSFPLPLLPNRSIGLIDVGILGGIVIAISHWLLSIGRETAEDGTEPRRPYGQSLFSATGAVLIAIVGWALLATSQAAHQEVAWREWRTVFLYAALFALTLALSTMHRRQSAFAFRDQHILLAGWLAGSTIVAFVALWHYGSDTLLIQAEGVQRVRAFYGSPNNLALYLERSLAVTLAFGFFLEQRFYRWLALGAGFVQAAALLLTFSKGALLLALPTQLGVLWLGGWYLLGRTQRSRSALWWLAMAGGIVALALLPFLGTERFQRLWDFETGTGFVRLQLWRSSLQMALDHPWFGVGPDNFLYAYRSLYILPAAWQEPNLNHPHNWPLDWWTRLGLPGLLLAVSWFGLICRQQWRQLRRGQQPVLALGLLAATIAALTHGLIDASYALPDLMIIWVLFSYLSTQSTATFKQ